jgi:hypothetical protein
LHQNVRKGLLHTASWPWRLNRPNINNKLSLRQPISNTTLPAKPANLERITCSVSPIAGIS